MNSELFEDLNDKTVLITGGTGSFGKECARTILTCFKPRKLVIFSRDELKQFEMSQEINTEKFGCKVSYYIGDVRDKERLHRAFNGIDIVIHAAAMKQVPAAEYNPFEAVKTNIIGAQNVINVAIDQKVQKVVALSTDKAVNPINLYGATKLCSDKLFASGNSYVGHAGTRFSIVRYGNVMGSRGSVIPLFISKRECGVIPITDAEMTRFWITIEAAVSFVLKSLRLMQGGEIFIPKIPSMRLLDLAKAIAPDCEFEIIGIRPGEKVHETLISEDDAPNTFEFEDHFIIATYLKQQQGDHIPGKPVAADFVYRSDTNTEWLNGDAIIKEINKIV